MAIIEGTYNRGTCGSRPHWMAFVFCCTVYAAVAAPPAPSHSKVEEVGLTDAPLRSLYPEIPKISKVRGGAANTI